MSGDRERNKKNEKDEKGEDEWGGEKWSGEKWAGDPLGRITSALIVIWAGIVLLVSNMADDQTLLGVDLSNPWAWIFTGAGVLIWIEVLLRLAMPEYRRPMGGRLILGTVFVIIGVGWLVEVSLWPLLIIAIGCAMLLGYFIGPRKF
jgi:hypothetical protein